MTACNDARRARPWDLTARSKEIKERLSTSSLGTGGPDRRDWSLSSTQPRPTGFGAYDSAQRKINLEMKKALQTAQIVLGDDSPEWGSSSVMPCPTGELSRYRGTLSTKTAEFIKTSSLKMGSLHPGSQYKTSMARDGLPIPDHGASAEIFKSNRALHDKLRNAGRVTRTIGVDEKDCTCYQSSNAMPDLTDRLREAHAESNPDIVRGIRRSSLVLGDARIKTLTTTQHDSMKEIAEAASKMEPGFNARVKQDPRYSSLQLGDDDIDQWTTSNSMPNWFDPGMYETDESTEKAF